MKLTNITLQELISKPLFELSQKELEALGLVLSMEITEYVKTDQEVSFKMENEGDIAYVVCEAGMPAALAKVKMTEEEIEANNGLSPFTMFGGVRSFDKLISTFRHFIAMGYTIRRNTKDPNYTQEEFRELVEVADHLVTKS